MMRIVVIGVLVLLLTGCCSDDLSRGFDLYNKSDNPISYCIPWRYGVFYPDTILPENNPHPHTFNKEYHFSFGEGCFHENALFDTFPTDTMSIFFFDPDTLDKYDWATIRDAYKVLVRYDLSHNDLRKLRWCIVFPPTMEMKDIKMYPSFSY